jgi:hypothetical protein
MSCPRLLGCCVALGALLTWNGAARAEDADADVPGEQPGRRPAASAGSPDVRRALAQELFADARRLMLEGRFTEACPLLAKSVELERTSGGLLNWAVCLEGAQLFASARVRYEEASAAAAREGERGREAIAKERMLILESKVDRLSLRYPDFGPTLSLRLDGAVLPPGPLEVGVPVDPGVHRLEVSAPGFEAQELVIDVRAGAGVVEVTLPKLVPVTAPSAFGAPSSPPSRDRSGVLEAPPHRDAPLPRPRRARPWFWLSAAAGVAAVSFGAYSGLAARSAWRERNRECEAGCTERAVRAGDRAEAHAARSTVSFAVGGAALGASVVIHFSEAR